MLPVLAAGLIAGAGGVGAQPLSGAEGQTALARAQAVREAEAIFAQTQAERENLSRSRQIARYERGLMLIEQVLSADTKNAHAWYLRALLSGARGEVRGLLAAAGEVPGIIEALERCISLDQRHVDAWATLSRVHTALPTLLGGDKDRAVEAARQAQTLLESRRDAAGQPGHNNIELITLRAVLARALWVRNDRGDRSEARRITGEIRASAEQNRITLPDRVADDLAAVR